MPPIKALAAMAALACTLHTPARAADRVLRVAPITDVQMLDPLYGSAWVNVVAGEMLYETLFSWDAALHPQPQMVDTWSTTPDGLAWRFTLRENLRFHDGQPVTTADVIPSMQRWLRLAQPTLRDITVSMVAEDPRSFTWTLKRPFPLMLDVLAAVPSRMPAIMRASDLVGPGVDPAKPVTSGIGSGPFRWNAALRVPGSRAVFDRNPDYVPRAEPPDGLAGGHVVRVDRVEWQVIPDAATVAAAMQKGEIDLWERPAADLVPLLAKNPDIRLQKLTPIATQTMMRPNALFPPFNDRRARQALNYVFEQADQMAAGYGDESIWKRCHSFFICGGPYGTEAGAEGYRQDFARARDLMAQAGYRGEKLTLISSHDIPWIGQQAEVAADALKRAGINVDVAWNDWATTITRVARQDAPDKGGWNLFLVTMTGPVMVLPVSNPAIDMSCTRANLWGWPCDEGVEKLRTAFMYADPATRPAALAALQTALLDAAPYAVLGQAEQLVAHRREVSGVLSSPVIAYWNVSKE